MLDIAELRQARAKLRAALEALYWGECSFMAAFERDADAATKAMRQNPGAFGRLNTFVGKLTVGRYQQKVVTCANAVIKLQKASRA